jgi:unsaturated chondroitin disaccharide hydrolase
MKAHSQTQARINAAVITALARMKSMLPRFTERFPAPSSSNGVYEAIDNVEWTNGFWTGMLWLGYQLCGDEDLRAGAQTQVRSFTHRIEKQIGTDHHDLGFLYSLSCVAAWKIGGDAAARASAIKAAELLRTRYLPVAGIIQAWGDLNDPAQAGRMIIDCNLNLPLLYWASEETGESVYREVANNHIDRAARYLVRPDDSTFHTFYMDPRSGAPLRGSTHQGYSDDSCWARGQAWGMYGFPLVYRYNGGASLIALSARLGNYFLARLPADHVCCWDLIFTDDKVERDTSAAAIAVCGLLEMARQMPITDAGRVHFEARAEAILLSLIDNYALGEHDAGDGLLREAVYHMPKNVGVRERVIWGDYFYLEALMRFTRVWDPYW